MKTLALSVLLALACARAYAQNGYPYRDTTNSTWTTFDAAWGPIHAWHSGLVTRARMLNVTPPVPVQTIAVITNAPTNGVAAWGSVVVSNLVPAVYTVRVDGVSGIVTAYPVLTQDLMADLDTYQEGLYTGFVSMVVTGAGDYQAYMNLSPDPDVLWVHLGQFKESRARLFSAYAIGWATNFTTNTYGWITNGSSYWSAPFNGFSGSGFRMGSVNAEDVYTATNFPATNGISFNGVYRWIDPMPFDGIMGANQTRGGFYLGGVVPTNWFDSLAAVYLYPGSPWALLGSSDGLVWEALALSGSRDNFSRYWRQSTNWYAGTNAIAGTLTRGLAWNFRQGGAWTESGWLVSGADYVLDYRRAVTTGYASVTVQIAGTTFGGAPTTATVTVSGSNTPVSARFAGVTNMAASGSLTNGDSIALVCTNRTLYTEDVSTWGTINKKVLDERIAALRPLRWTVKDFTAIYTNSIKFQGYCLYSYGMTTAADAYNYAQSHMGIGWTDLGPNPLVDSSDAHYGAVSVSGPYLGTYEAEITVWRYYYRYVITNLDTRVPHSVDVLVNAYEIPNNDVGYAQEFYCDILGASTRGLTWVYTNIATSTNSGHTVVLHVDSTNWPVEGVDYPAWGGVNQVIGFQSPKLQAVIKWEPEF